MKPAAFAYDDPASLGLALELLAREDEEVKVLAGGQSLVPLLNFRLARPDRLVDLNRVDELAYLRRDGDVLRIGALARHADLERSPEVAEVSADVLLPLAAASDPGADELVIANCLAQVQALMAGRESPEPYRVYPGSRPLSLLVFRRLDPATLGALIALYEHKVFVESVLWDINPFDQWGVELGKTMAGRVAREIASDAPPDPGLDASTRALLLHYRARRELLR